ncbi:MAG TPA: tRNA guanosine(34) transglycosylase Tgt [Candidatus Paceibacterota bacterium]|nr:tRNA guanosine(34) transglycosylase Tgt [Candidatus Paceibacterota bacterium]
MISFKILKQSSRSNARLGVIETPHGAIETPAFVPVATRGSVRLIPSERAAELGTQLLICNTFHLHLTPGEALVKEAGGLHAFMGWEKPILTDSGGFQVFSMGFGMDHGMGKILQEEGQKTLAAGAQPRRVRITEEGVFFRSPLDGRELFLGPRESIAIQEALGSDIMFAFDECPSPLADQAYLEQSLEKTHRWAAQCIAAKATDQALYGIVQGGGVPELRRQSAEVIGAMEGFSGFGIGGEFGYDKESLERMAKVVTDALPAGKPRHLLGVGHPEDFDYIARGGADTFDCITPTHYARHGTAFTSEGRLDMGKAIHREPAATHIALDPACACPVCTTYSRAYIAHLVHAHEPSGAMLLSMHNVFRFNALARELRERIGNDEL